MIVHVYPRILRTFSPLLESGFVAPISVVGLFGAMILRGVYLLPAGYDGDGGLNAFIGYLVTIWVIASVARRFQPVLNLATAAQALSLFFMLSLLAALAAAANAVGSGEYVDHWFDLIDTTIFPAFEWRTAILLLPHYPLVYEYFHYIYASLNWQPFVYMGATFVFGEPRDQIAFVTAWGFGLFLCILPFHWLPSVSAYGFYGITRDEMVGSKFGLPWDLIPIVQGLRQGTIQAIDLDCLSGLVTMPSFHACAATILAWAFWRYAFLRWPFVALNVAMAAVAVPMGGHYLIDVIVGFAAGLASIQAATYLSRGTAPLSKRASYSLTAIYPRRPALRGAILAFGVTLTTKARSVVMNGFSS
jgi:membrane-associated phospholipid phosphatase